MLLIIIIIIIIINLCLYKKSYRLKKSSQMKRNSETCSSLVITATIISFLSITQIEREAEDQIIFL